MNNLHEADERLRALLVEQNQNAKLSPRPLRRSLTPAPAGGASSGSAHRPSSSPGPAPVARYTFTTPLSSASGGFGTKPCGPVAHLLLSHDPTDPPRLFPVLQPDKGAVLKATVSQQRQRLLLDSVVVMTASGVGVPEQRPAGASADMLTVSSEMVKVHQMYTSKGVRTALRSQLKALHLPAVYCSDGCEVDAAYYIEVEGVRRVLAVHEFKAPAAAPRVGFQQSVKYACAAAAGLCQGGVPPDQVVVPLMVSTGLLERHGAAYMAAPMLPAAVVTSPTLDINDKQGAAAAHLYRRKAQEQVDRLASAVGVAATSPAFAELKGALFPSDGGAGVVPKHLLSFQSTALWPKWGAVSAKAPRGTDVQLFDMYRAYQALYASGASRFVCFPNCYAMGIKCAPTGSNAVMNALLFPNLQTLGYQCALPTTLKVARMYVEALKEAVAAVHRADVVHGDLYVSNIMWREGAGGDAVELKLIDWDTVFFAHDGVPLHWAAMWRKLPKWRQYRRTLSEKAREVDAVRALDLFMVHTLEHFCSSNEQRWRCWMRRRWPTRAASSSPTCSSCN